MVYRYLSILWLALNVGIEPAFACICACDSERAKAGASQILSQTDLATAGIITQLSTREEPRYVDPTSADEETGPPTTTWRVVRILPFNTVSGAGLANQEIWLPSGTSCQQPAVVGLWVNLLASYESDRLVARGGVCGCDEAIVFPDGGGLWIYFTAMIALAATLLGAGVFFLRSVLAGRNRKT